MKKNYLLISILVILTVLLISPHASFAMMKKIGEPCLINSDCNTQNCMESSYNGDSTGKYCACDSDEDWTCQEYSDDPGADWDCVLMPGNAVLINDPTERQNLMNKSRNLNYCKSATLGIRYAVNTPPPAQKTEKKDIIKIAVPKLSLPIPNLPSWSSYEIQPGEPINIPWLADYIIAIYKYAITIASVLAVVAIMIGGVLYLTAGGLPSNIQRAQQIIIGSITGLIILICSHLVLTMINPELVNLKSLTIETIKPEELDLERVGGAVGGGETRVQAYNNMACPDTTEGTTFEIFTTSYYLPSYGDSMYGSFECNVAMQCLCPKGRDNSQGNICRMSTAYPPPWSPCKKIPEGSQVGVDYCNKTFSGARPVFNQTIACSTECFNVDVNGCEIFINGQKYICQDTGCAIKGRHIDILSSSRAQALGTVGVKTVTLGKNCTPKPSHKSPKCPK